jgi:hypothetical protein
MKDLLCLVSCGGRFNVASTHNLEKFMSKNILVKPLNIRIIILYVGFFVFFLQSFPAQSQKAERSERRIIRHSSKNGTTSSLIGAMWEKSPLIRFR